MRNTKFIRLLVGILFVLILPIILSSCAGTIPGKALNIVIDMGGLNFSKDIEKAVESFATAHRELEITTDFIVFSEMDESNGFPERNAKVQQIRAAMLSGKGPDVIISFDQSNTIESPFFSNSRDALIPNPYKSMQADVFFDLTDKLSENDILEKSNSAFTDASSIKGKTYLIPLTYSLYGLVNNSPDNSGEPLSFESSIQTIKAYPALYYDYLSNAQVYFGKSLLDFSTLEVAISEEEASLWAQELCTTALKNSSAPNSDLSILEITSYNDRSDIISEKTRFVPVMSADGSFISKITGYAGILANSSNKDMAFEFIRHIINSPELSSYGFCVNPNQNSQQFDKLDLPSIYKQDLIAAQERVNKAYYNNDGSFQLFVSCYPYFMQQAQLQPSITQALSKMQLILRE